MLLDSTFVHDLVRNEETAVAKLDDLVEKEIPVALSAITVFEVGVGLRGVGTRYRRHFDGIVEETEVVPLGRIAAFRALEAQRVLYDRGEAIRARDVLIAGTALARGEAVLTRNVDEFERVVALSVESY
jgi:tRNA(fMet)-specific endonuclease VapC